VLLTGASGFVGRGALAALAAAGHEVHALSREPQARQEGVTWHQADLLAGADIVEQVRPQTLVHLAWYAKHGSFWTSPENLRWVGASLELLRRFAAAGGRRAVLAGSCAEYDWSREVYPEDAPVRPATLYGASKQGVHDIAERFALEADLSLAWGRLFFLYGPGEAPGRFVASLIRALLAGQAAPLTDGTQRRDFLHCADAGAAFAALAGSPVTGAVNIASGEGIPLRDLALQIARSLQAEDRLEIGALPRREHEPQALVADVTRLSQEVGWSPRLTLDEGLAETIEWWRGREGRG
jgi:nucleoside-diphosphate-sugar epimerase